MTGGCCQLSGDSVISHTCQYTASPRDWLWATVNDLTGLRQGLGPETLNSPPGSCSMNYKSQISCLLDSQVVRKDIFPRFWHFCDLGSLVSQTMIQQRLRLVPTWFDFLFSVLDFRHCSVWKAVQFSGHHVSSSDVHVHVQFSDFWVPFSSFLSSGLCVQVRKWSDDLTWILSYSQTKLVLINLNYYKMFMYASLQTKRSCILTILLTGKLV